MDEARHVHCECDWITAEDMAIFAYRQKHREEIASLRAKLEKADALVAAIIDGHHESQDTALAKALANYKSIK